MFNIQKAVSRLDYAPKLKEVKITDIKKGLGVFVPKPESAVSYAALKETLKKAGYALDSAHVTVAGKLVRAGEKWLIVSNSSGQQFLLKGKVLDQQTDKIEAGSEVEITGIWKTEGEGATVRETIDLQTIKKAEIAPKAAAQSNKITFGRENSVGFIKAGFVLNAGALPEPSSIKEEETALAPIRTTSPGLTVFQGGAITPRFFFIKQHLGDLNVSRQILNVSASYTPTQRLQLEAEVPISRTSFDDGINAGSSAGLGNITLWGKYRFFRKVKTYGDRQASARFGLELPTSSKSAPNGGQVNAPTFVRRQLSSNNGGLASHVDVAFSQAGGRFIFGGNVEGVFRTERDGFRLGHEIRVNTDFEYVLLPFDYQQPGKELFLIFETNFIARSRGRLGGAEVPGSSSKEFYISPGLQFAAHPQFVIEGSVQIPVAHKSGAMMLKTDLNFLLGVRYLF